MATCSNLWGTWEWLCCKLSLAASTARLGASEKVVQGTLRPATACLQFLDLWEFLGKFTAWAQAGYLCRLASKRDSSRVYKLGEGCLRESPGWNKSCVSQVKGESHLVPACTCRLCERRVQQRYDGTTWQSQRAAPPALVLKPDNSVPFHMSLELFELLFLFWCLKQMFLSEFVLGPFKKIPGSIATLFLTWREPSLISTATCYESSSPWHWCSRLVILA